MIQYLIIKLKQTSNVDRPLIISITNVLINQNLIENKRLSLKRGLGGCGHGFDGCDGLGGLGGFDGLRGFGRFDEFSAFDG